MDDPLWICVLRVAQGLLQSLAGAAPFVQRKKMQVRSKAHMTHHTCAGPNPPKKADLKILAQPTLRFRALELKNAHHVRRWQAS
jgi:hypothetical protein